MIDLSIADRLRASPGFRRVESVLKFVSSSRQKSAEKSSRSIIGVYGRSIDSGGDASAGRWRGESGWVDAARPIACRARRNPAPRLVGAQFLRREKVPEPTQALYTCSRARSFTHVANRHTRNFFAVLHTCSRKRELFNKARKALKRYCALV